MSEYEYYEFQAIDRRLTADEMADLRSFSTRAVLTGRLKSRIAVKRFWSQQRQNRGRDSLKVEESLESALRR